MKIKNVAAVKENTKEMTHESYCILPCPDDSTLLSNKKIEECRRTDGRMDEQD